MPFEKGMAKSGGRKVGVQNRATGEIKGFAASIIEDETYQEQLRARILRGEAVQMEILLWHYRYGRPRPTKEEPVTISCEVNR
jgi:hypothetical protein